MDLKERLKYFGEFLKPFGISAYYVGGYVRDTLLQLPTDDIDICVVGVHEEDFLTNLLRRYFTKVSPQVGESFPVWICEWEGQKIDIAMARRERKTGTKHTDFKVETMNVTIEEDLRRRDLTINALAIDIITGEMIDPFNGEEHLYRRMAVAVSEAFAEDPLRVLRAARFIARFNLYPTVKLIELCKSLSPEGLAQERFGLELKKVMSQAIKPSVFFDFLHKVDWLRQVFPEVHSMIGVPQDPVHHPEGDVYVHTMLTMNAATDSFIRLVMLCHDMGKVRMTVWHEDKGKWKSIGHEHETTDMMNMLTRISYDNLRFLKQVRTLVRLHMIREEDVSEKMIRRNLRALMEKNLTYEQLVEVVRCDMAGRPPRPAISPNIGQKRAAKLLKMNAMTPIVTGKALLAEGYKPGKHMKELIDKGLEWQDRGTLNRDNWLKMIRQYKK